MRATMRHLPYGFVVLTCAIVSAMCLPRLVVAQSEDRLAGPRKVYEDSVRKTEEEYAGKVKSWPADYTKELKALQLRAQKAGDLDGLLAVDKEIKRFEKSGKILKEDLVSVPDILVLQTKYQKMEGTLGQEKSQKVLALSEKYIEKLTEHQKQLTIAGRIDEALLYNAETKRVKASPEVTSAEFAVAAYKVDHHAEKPPDTKEKTDHGKETKDPVKTEFHKQPVQPTAGVQIYEGGKEPPAPRGAALKRLSLHPTGNVPLIQQQVTVAMSLGAMQELVGSYSTPMTRYCVRLKVNARQANLGLTNVKVAVQYYAKSIYADPSVKRVKKLGEPDTTAPVQMMQVQRVSLAKLDTEGSYIDCPAVPDTGGGYSSYGGGYYSWNGKELAGVIVTVLRDDDSLVFQGVSIPALKGLATIQIPESREEKIAKAREQVEAAEREHQRLQSATYSAGATADAHAAADKARAALQRARDAMSALMNSP